MAKKRTEPNSNGGGLGANSVEYVPVADLIPYARNARTHSDEQIAQIAGSIQEFGFNNPVLIDGQNSIIAGHGRVLAAGRLKLEQVPCIRLTHLTDIQKRAYILADNKLALNAGWDAEALSLELAELSQSDLDMTLMGFADYELDPLLAANWEPPAVEDMPDREEQHGHKIDFSSDQWETVKAALAKCREDNDRGDELTDGQCMELICQKFLS